MKKDLVADIVKMLVDKPVIEMSNEYWSTEQGVYSRAGIKKKMREKGYTNDMVDQALHEIWNDKALKPEIIQIYNKKYKENYPYHYYKLTDEELDFIKKRMS